MWNEYIVSTWLNINFRLQYKKRRKNVFPNAFGSPGKDQSAFCGGAEALTSLTAYFHTSMSY